MANQTDDWKRFICKSCLGSNPYVRMTRKDSGKDCRMCTSPFTVFRWRPNFDARYRSTELCQMCSRLKDACQVCLLHLKYRYPVLPVTPNIVRAANTILKPWNAGELSQQNIQDRIDGVDDRSRSLYIGGLDDRIHKEDLYDRFYVHGEIERIKMSTRHACAFVTYTTREAAEKAFEELSNRLVIKCLHLKLLRRKNPQASRPEGEGSAEDAVGCHFSAAAMGKDDLKFFTSDSEDGLLPCRFKTPVDGNVLTY